MECNSVTLNNHRINEANVFSASFLHVGVVKFGIKSINIRIWGTAYSVKWVCALFIPPAASSIRSI